MKTNAHLIFLVGIQLWSIDRATYSLPLGTRWRSVLPWCSRWGSASGVSFLSNLAVFTYLISFVITRAGREESGAPLYVARTTSQSQCFCGIVRVGDLRKCLVIFSVWLWKHILNWWLYHLPISLDCFPRIFSESAVCRTPFNLWSTRIRLISNHCQYWSQSHDTTPRTTTCFTETAQVAREIGDTLGYWCVDVSGMSFVSLEFSFFMCPSPASLFTFTSCCMQHNIGFEPITWLLALQHISPTVHVLEVSHKVVLAIFASSLSLLSSLSSYYFHPVSIYKHVHLPSTASWEGYIRE